MRSSVQQGTGNILHVHTYNLYSICSQLYHGVLMYLDTSSVRMISCYVMVIHQPIPDVSKYRYLINSFFSNPQ